MKPLDSLREELQGILAGKEYQVYYRENQNFFLDLLQRLKNWLNSILKNLFPQADIAKTTVDWLAYGIAAVGIFLLLLMLYLLGSRFVRQGHVKRKRLDLAKELTLTARHHLGEAHSLAGQGEYSIALRHLFLGFILFLNQQRWIEAKAWKTNWEYHAELKNYAPHLADFFTSLAVKFEEAMYGGRPITRDDYWLY
ncbi:MAG TPA: DUF4129 domain-containing protein, partial [Verrucomicrobiae bacterium]|nr:DUF4129 domain-containing protein [Verrucomicrobiae bacterium]